MQSLEEVSNNLPEDVRAQVTKLTLVKAVQGVWTRDGLVNLPSLHTIVFNQRSVCLHLRNTVTVDIRSFA